MLRSTCVSAAKLTTTSIASLATRSAIAARSAMSSRSKRSRASSSVSPRLRRLPAYVSRSTATRRSTARSVPLSTRRTKLLPMKPAAPVTNSRIA
jgi:hypothetical protein